MPRAGGGPGKKADHYWGGRESSERGQCACKNGKDEGHQERGAGKYSVLRNHLRRGTAEPPKCDALFSNRMGGKSEQTPRKRKLQRGW